MDTARAPGHILAAARLNYLASYLRLRIVIGALGMALPLLLVLGDWLLLSPTQLGARPSLSSYYHSGMRDVFVGVLVSLGLFLLTYRVADDHADNAITTIAGISALLVAFFPTSLPMQCGSDPQNPLCGSGLTPLQQALGSGAVAAVHGASSLVLFSLLAVMSFRYAARERRKPRRPGHRSPAFWAAFHTACGGAVLAGEALVVMRLTTGLFAAHGVLIGEIVMSLAFGLSWFAAGADLEVLLSGRRRAAAGSAGTARDATAAAEATARDEP